VWIGANGGAAHRSSQPSENRSDKNARGASRGPASTSISITCPRFRRHALGWRNARARSSDSALSRRGQLLDLPHLEAVLDSVIALGIPSLTVDLSDTAKADSDALDAMRRRESQLQSLNLVEGRWP